MSWYEHEFGFDQPAAEQAAALFAPLNVGIVQGYVVQWTIFGAFDSAAYLAVASSIRPDLALFGR